MNTNKTNLFVQVKLTVECYALYSNIGISTAIKYQVLSIFKSQNHIDEVLQHQSLTWYDVIDDLNEQPYWESCPIYSLAGLEDIGQLWIFWRREVSGRHTKCTPSFLSIPTFALCQNPAHYCHLLYSAQCFVISCAQNGSCFSWKSSKWPTHFSCWKLLVTINLQNMAWLLK